MQAFLIAFVAIIAVASAFAPHRAIRAPARSVVRLHVFAEQGPSTTHNFSLYSVLAPPYQSMKMYTSKISLAIPAALMPFVIPAMSIAAEGTGRVRLPAHELRIVASPSLTSTISRKQAFGIDDSRLIWAALLPSFIIFPLYNKWSSDQEGDDFFDGYEKRRNG
jgi:hypothetical protein